VRFAHRSDLVLGAVLVTISLRTAIIIMQIQGRPIHNLNTGIDATQIATHALFLTTNLVATTAILIKAWYDHLTFLSPSI
jgi:hypothetical protein